MPDTFALTVISIVIFTFITAFIRGRTKDKCVKEFEGEHISLEETDGKVVYGKLSVESTGMELIYRQPNEDSDGHIETSYILYKSEYSKIQALIRYLYELSEEEREKREKEIRRTYHPNFIKKFKRNIQNVFRTVRDSLVDVINLILGQAKKSTPIGRMSASQDKYFSKVKDEYVATIGNAYEPLLERHIGKLVVLEISKAERISEYCGVLKGYTSEFIEIMDVDYKLKEEQDARKVDMIIPRKLGVVRHLGE